MIQLMIIVFIVGYLAISLEHVLKINKAAVALFMAVVLWILYAYVAPAIVPVLYPRELADFIVQGNLSSLSLAEQSLRFVAEKQMVTRLGYFRDYFLFIGSDDHRGAGGFTRRLRPGFAFYGGEK